MVDGSHDKIMHRIEAAMARVILDHPMLRVGMRGANSRKPAFVELQSIDFSQLVEWRTFSPEAEDYESDLWAFIQARVDEKPTQLVTLPGWRAVVLRVEGTRFVDIMIEFGHAHLDGMSIKLFHEEMRRYLSSYHDNDDNLQITPEGFQDRVLTIPVEKRRDLPPPMHELYKFSFTTRYTLSTLWQELKPAALHEKTGMEADWAPIRAQPFVTLSRVFRLHDSLLQNILTKCRAHNTTLTGLLDTLLAVILALRLPPENSRGFIGNTIVDLRPLIRKTSKYLQRTNIDPRHIMENILTTVDHEFSPELVALIRAKAEEATKEMEGEGHEQVEENTRGAGDWEQGYKMLALEEFVWLAAARVRAEIQARLDDGTNDKTGLLKYISDCRTLHKDTMKKPRALTYSVSNLGVIDGAPPVVAKGKEKEGSVKQEGNVERKEDDEDRWTIERATFSLSAELPQSAFLLCPVSVKGKELSMYLSWQDCTIDAELGDAVTADLETWLRFFGREED